MAGATTGVTVGYRLCVSNLIPVGMDRHELAAVLRDILARVEAGDSFEGNLEYLMPDPEPAPEGWPSPNAEFWVTAAYRIGNREGQGGMRMIGEVPPQPPPPPDFAVLAGVAQAALVEWERIGGRETGAPTYAAHLGIRVQEALRAGGR